MTANSSMVIPPYPCGNTSPKICLMYPKHHIRQPVCPFPGERANVFITDGVPPAVAKSHHPF